MDSGRVQFVVGHFVLGLAPVIAIVLGLQTAVNASQLAPAVRKVQGVTPIVGISHAQPLSFTGARWTPSSPHNARRPCSKRNRLMRPAPDPMRPECSLLSTMLQLNTVAAVNPTRSRLTPTAPWREAGDEKAFR